MLPPRFSSNVFLPKNIACNVAYAAVMGMSALCSPAARAQAAAITPRIAGPINESSLITLRGNVPPRARAEFDKGKAAPATEFNFMRLVLSRSPEQEAALEKLMAQQLDKSSPNYHHWLTPEQFGTLYGPADSDIAAIVAWLQSHGLKVESVSTGRTDIAFSGTVSQVEEAFHTSIHSFDDRNEQFLSNTTDPSIPVALAPVVSGVAQLNTIHPKAYGVPGRPGQLDPASQRLLPANGIASAARPELTTGSAGGYFFYLVPADAATIYDSPNSLNANLPSGATSYTGTGVTIGIGGDALIQPTTVTNYRTKFVGDTASPTISNIAPLAVAGNDTDEGYLDVEISGGVAPGASLVFYTSGSLQNAINKAVNDNAIDILSLSFGECELSLGNSGNTLLNTYWQQASMQGIAVVIATGDSGSANCDNNNTETAATSGLQVSGYASTPYNIAVGGTDYNSLVTGFTTYVNITNGTLQGSAKSYIPEVVWNQSTTLDTTVNANIPALDMKNNTNITAGGGGASTCSTNTSTSTANGTCTSGYPKPSWQRGAGVPSSGERDIPDVSLFAGAGMDGAAWLVCTDDTFTQGTTTYTENCTGTQFAFAGFGGTSTSAPAFAGVLALVQQKTGSRLGLAAKDLYDIFNGAHAGSVFHDITAGNNSVVCTAATPDCQKNTAGNYFLTGYDAASGYDLATGMGSVDVTQLINAWATATGSGSATITITPSATAITSLQNLTVTVVVSGALGAPTGTVSLAGGGYSSSPTALDATGTASFSIPAGTLQAGADTLTATYSGDVNYATTTSSTTVTVTQAGFTVTASTPASVTPGNTVTSNITVSTNNGYSGTVALSCVIATMPSGAADVPACTITPSTPITLGSGASSGTATATFITTAPIASLVRPRVGGWEEAGGTVLALLVFFGIPSRRRSWRALAGLWVIALALAGLSACGSSTVNASGGGANSNPGTTPGTYTYTLSGTGTPAYTPPTVTITLTVN